MSDPDKPNSDERDGMDLMAEIRKAGEGGDEDTVNTLVDKLKEHEK